MLSFVLVICYFNDGTLEPLKLSVVTKSKEDMKNLDRNDREINGPRNPGEISSCLTSRA